MHARLTGVMFLIVELLQAGVMRSQINKRLKMNWKTIVYCTKWC